jgi:hypothetical protein
MRNVAAKVQEINRVKALHTAFDAVKHHRQWQRPIDAVVKIGKNCENVNLILEAIEFFTGQPKAQIEVTSAGTGNVRIQAAGYWAFTDS